MARMTSTGDRKDESAYRRHRHLESAPGRAPAGRSAQFDNDPAGFRALIDWIGTPVECVVYEATGPYHRDFEEALSKAKLPLAKVNPWQARRFAEATGSRAKTDAVDARKLAQLAASLDPRRTPAPSKTAGSRNCRWSGTG